MALSTIDKYNIVHDCTQLYTFAICTRIALVLSCSALVCMLFLLRMATYSLHSLLHRLSCSGLAKSGCSWPFSQKIWGLGSRLGFPTGVGSEDCLVDGRRLIAQSSACARRGWVSICGRRAAGWVRWERGRSAAARTVCTAGWVVYGGWWEGLATTKESFPRQVVLH